MEVEKDFKGALAGDVVVVVDALSEMWDMSRWFLQSLLGPEHQDDVAYSPTRKLVPSTVKVRSPKGSPASGEITVCTAGSFEETQNLL
jgi:hypothetical protein